MGIRKTATLGGVAAMIAAVSAAGVGVSYASGGGGGGGGGGACSVPSTRYPTIQSAVDAPACSSVKVAAGSYAENVKIARRLTLSGAKARQDARTRRSGGESVINGGA